MNHQLLSINNRNLFLCIFFLILLSLINDKLTDKYSCDFIILHMRSDRIYTLS